MHILLLGGSNTGIWEGWAHHFVILAEHRLGARVTNDFLGAVGSLFGLLRLLKRELEDLPPPDLIVFEYTLNDILLTSDNAVSAILVRDTLQAISDLCLRRNITLHFLCLEAKNYRKLSRLDPGRLVPNTYAKIARLNGMPKPLFQRDALGGRVDDEDYLDGVHLNSSASRVVAEALFSRLRGSPRGTPRTVPKRTCAFEYIDAMRAVTKGRAQHSRVDVSVFQGSLVEMRRPSATTWQAKGRLVGIAFRTRANSGWYSVSVDGKFRRKNGCITDLSVLPEVIAMQYPNIRTPARGAIMVAMPDDEPKLMRLVHDLSPMEQEPTHHFIEQELAIIGLMMWHGPFGIDRLTEPLDFVWRAILRRWPWR